MIDRGNRQRSNTAALDSSRLMMLLKVLSIFNTNSNRENSEHCTLGGCGGCRRRRKVRRRNENDIEPHHLQKASNNPTLYKQYHQSVKQPISDIKFTATSLVAREVVMPSRPPCRARTSLGREKLGSPVSDYGLFITLGLLFACIRGKDIIPLYLK